MNYQIKRLSEISQKVKGSKFIGRCYPVESPESAKSIIKAVEEEHHKATHVCWAFRVFQGNTVLVYNSDAGEPRGSAGPPIQAALEGRSLVNTLCIVIRYFGGTKLGIGGLIRAYGKTAALALDDAGRKSFNEISTLKIRIALAEYSDLMRILRKYHITIQQEFKPEFVMITLKIPSKELNDLQSDLGLITSAVIEID
ncbi:MAG TPA: YigZ family protein [Candidatus Marinimicrobia bacterium]|nr:YigZ family protein [Candidatus Neomarinimicrobiota bacterium]